MCFMPKNSVLCNTKVAVTGVYNNSCLVPSYRQVLKKFRKMYARRAFLHWFERFGMETADFESAESEMGELINLMKMSENDLD